MTEMAICSIRLAALAAGVARLPASVGTTCLVSPPRKTLMIP